MKDKLIEWILTALEYLAGRFGFGLVDKDEAEALHGFRFPIECP